MNDINIDTALYDQFCCNRAQLVGPIRKFAQVVGILKDTGSSGVLGRCVLWNSGELEFCFIGAQTPIDAELDLLPQIKMHRRFESCALESLDWTYPVHGNLPIGSVWRQEESVMARLEKVPRDRNAIVVRERVLDLNR